MRGRLLSLTALIAIAGCAPYSQLMPKPPLSNEETPGYVELKKGKNWFDLKKKEKYYIAFPAPKEDRFYLVVTSPQKRQFADGFTADFEKKKPGTPIPNETWAPDSMSVFPLDRSRPAYFWFVEQVSQSLYDVPLHYRYVPQWRFKFEHGYTAQKQALAFNRVDRTLFNAIGTTRHLDAFNYQQVIDSVTRHTNALQQSRKALSDLEALFPTGLPHSGDRAYLDYRELRNSIEEEIAFQTDYAEALGFFSREYQTRGNPFAFLGYSGDFLAYFTRKVRSPAALASETRGRLRRRLDEIPGFLDQRLRSKDDGAPLDTAYFRMGAIRELGALCEAAGTGGSDLSALLRFMLDFDAKSRIASALRDSGTRITEAVRSGPSMPPDGFFQKLAARVAPLQNRAPAGIDDSYGAYRNFTCAKKLNQELGMVNTGLLQLSSLYRQAEAIVQQLNVLRDQNEFSAMIGLLKQNTQLGFLAEKYRPLDRMSLEQQKTAIDAALTERRWAEAESSLRKLFDDQNFIDAGIIPEKEVAVRDYEDRLYAGVEAVTRERVNKFCEANVSTYDNIDTLYADSVFLPAYAVTFTSGSRADLAQRRAQLGADLERIKQVEFPSKSIELLYEQLVRSPDDNGVLKARAIVAHGRHYAGDDKEVKRRVAEADPLVAKWIVKAKEARRVFVVPVTDNRRGKNKYVVRFNVDIPTDAVFPVYEVNIRLPREVAQNAEAEQWYDAITCNRVPLKNEGRFTITAPTAANNYECQIAPVQMNKDKANVLEIVFRHSSFKVLQVSVMVQKPIIKKN